MELPAQIDFHTTVMPRFACLLAPLGFALLGPAVATGQDSVTEKPVPPAKTEEPAKPARAISPHAAELLAEGTRKFTVAKPPEKKPEPAAGTAKEPDKPANEIVRLPQMTVRAMRVPSPEDVRTPRGLELYAMKKYLGDPDSFSRGVLNRFTFADAWKHVPILGRWSRWGSSPEQTALDQYYDDEVRKKLQDLMNLQAMSGRETVAKPSAAGEK